MTRRLAHLVVVLIVLAVVAPRAWGQFLTEEERKGMFTVSLAYSMRDYDMVFRGASPPIEEIDEILEAFSVNDELDSFELSAAWVSFGYVELRGVVGLADHDLTSTHEDAAFDTTFTSSDNLIYGLGATVRYPLADWWLIALDVSFLLGRFDDVGGEVAQLDVVDGLTARVDDVDWRELTLTPMMQFRYGSFLPYVGVRLSRLTTELNTTMETAGGESFGRIVEFENDEDWSAVVGLTWRASSLIMAEVQAQLLNNERITVAIKFTF